MRESSCGIFLLLRRGSATFEDKESRDKPDSAESMTFAELVDWLTTGADTIQRSKENISLRVIGINLTLRQQRDSF